MYQMTPYNVVKRLSDGAFVPFDPANTDYQQYLAWIAEGNKPINPDEIKKRDASTTGKK